MSTSRIPAFIEKCCLSFEDNERLTALCQDIALEIQSGRGNITSVVEELGPHLTNTDVGTRANAVKTLSLTLSELPKDYLRPSEMDLLMAFYRDRLNDHHSIGPSTIIGILAIVQMNHLTKDGLTQLIHAVFQNIQCQSEVQQTRRNIYLILKIALESRMDDLKYMGPDLVYGVISAMDGECDPRNLMVLFNFLPMFIKKFPLGHLTEEMFEVIACYFPIDFNSSGITGDKNKITRDNLAEALAPCLCAIPQFGTYCIPHIMEKLDSEREIAKLDALHLLEQGAPTFGSDIMKNHLDELWPILKKSIINSSNKQVQNIGLTALSAIVKTLADDEEARDGFVESIINDARWLLLDGQLNFYWPAEKLMEVIAATDKISCSQVLRKLVPLWLGQYSTKTRINEKVILVETLNNFIRISGKFRLTISDIPELAWTDVPGMYLNELATEDSNLRAKILTGFIIQKFSLNDQQRLILYEKISCFIDSDVVDQVRKACHDVLSEFGKTYPKELLGLLKRNFRIDIADPIVIFTKRLQAINTVANIKEIGLEYIPQMVTIATTMTRSKVDQVALSCILNLVDDKSTISFDIEYYLHNECNAIDRFMSMPDDQSIEKFTAVSKIFRSIVAKLKVDDQQAVVDRYIDVIENDPRVSERQALLFEGLLTALRPNVGIKNINTLIPKLSEIAIDTVNNEAAVSCCKIIASLLNKMNQDNYFDTTSNYLRDRMKNIIESNDSHMKMKKAAIVLHTWVTKSLICKGTDNSDSFLDYQINIMRMPIGLFVAEQFKCLVDKSENTLTETNFCTIKIFYKQRIFQKMIESNGLFNVETRQNYLIGLAHLVEQLPIELSIMHLEKLVPLLIESLSLDDEKLLVSTLKTLKLLLYTNDDIFLSQIQWFIPRCLHLSSLNKMHVRIAALECLASYCDYPVVELVKHKQHVLDKLGDAVDDRKRLVRQIAVKARTRWYLVGAPGT